MTPQLPKPLVVVTKAFSLHSRKCMRPALALLLSAVFVSSLACGKPVQIDNTPLPPPAPPEDLMKPVIGDAAIGNQCPYGSVAEPRPVKLGLWDCPIELKALELTQPPTPLIFSADCYKKTLIIRTQDRRMDTIWEVMPDGTFDITIDGGIIKIKDDGVGNLRCSSYASLEVWGHLDCTDRDRLIIDLNTIWWLGKGQRPDSLTGGATGVTECKLPSGCYLHAGGKLPQC